MLTSRLPIFILGSIFASISLAQTTCSSPNYFNDNSNNRTSCPKGKVCYCPGTVCNGHCCNQGAVCARDPQNQILDCPSDENCYANCPTGTHVCYQSSQSNQNGCV